MQYISGSCLDFFGKFSSELYLYAVELDLVALSICLNVNSC